MDINAKIRNHFSPQSWKASIERFPLSGLRLVDEINALQPNIVVDIGCGYNPFKGKISNLIGIDIVNDAADIVCDLHDAPFAFDSVDVCLALGSINFGSRETIRAGLTKAHSWLRTGGLLFMRANPGEPIGSGIEVFPWSRTEIAQFSEEIGFSMFAQVQEENLVLTNGTPAKRLFWIYQKSAADPDLPAQALQ